MISVSERLRADYLKSIEKRAHAGYALWFAAHLENNLADLVATYMPKLSNRLREKLFSGYGPLASFSAKIDLAYALGLIPEPLRRDLHVIREIRNEFAHSTDNIHFDSDSIRALLAKFSDYDAKLSNLLFYIDKMVQCGAIIEPQMKALAAISPLNLRLTAKDGA